jgi:hypothetical protein
MGAVSLAFRRLGNGKQRVCISNYNPIQQPSVSTTTPLQLGIHNKLVPSDLIQTPSSTHRRLDSDELGRFRGMKSFKIFLGSGCNVASRTLC